MINLIVAGLNLYSIHTLQKSKELYQDNSNLYNVLYWANWVFGLANICVVVNKIFE